MADASQSEGPGASSNVPSGDASTHVALDSPLANAAETGDPRTRTGHTGLLDGRYATSGLP